MAITHSFLKYNLFTSYVLGYVLDTVIIKLPLINL